MAQSKVYDYDSVSQRYNGTKNQKKHKRSAKALENIAWRIKNGQSKINAMNTYHIIKKNTAFSIYLPWLKNLSQITIKKNNAVNCVVSFELESLNKLTKKLCENVLLYKLKTKKSSIYQKRVQVVLEEKAKTNKQSFLKRVYQTIPSKHRSFYANFLTDVTIKYKLIPRSSMLRYYKHNKYFTKYLNEIRYFDERESKAVSKPIRSSVRAVVNIPTMTRSQVEEARGLIRNLVNITTSNITFTNLYAYKIGVKTNSRFFEWYYNLVKDKLMEDDLRQDLLLKHLKTYLTYGQTKKAFNLVKKEKLLDNLNTYDRSLRYWVINIISSYDEKKAKQLYQELIDSKIADYYSILALNQLDTKQRNVFVEKVLREPGPIDNYNFADSKELDHSLKRIAGFSATNTNILLKAETQFLLTQISSSGLKPDQIHTTLKLSSDILINNGRYLPSFYMLQRAVRKNIVEVSLPIIKRMFPFAYKQLIESNNKDINPLIYYSLIRQESGFDRKAKSRVGARGLMQLMPRTARSLTKRLRIEDLYQPTLNLKLGKKYFNKLFQRQDQSLIWTLASYNAGESNVKKWKRYLALDKPYLAIEEIPFQETQKYVKLIIRNLFFYNFLKSYDNVDEPVDKSIQLTFKAIR